MELNVNHPSNSGEQSINPSISRVSTKNKFLEESSLGEIATVFSRFSSEGRVTIVPIGFPRAGKSLLLSSLFWYARNGEDPTFNIKIETGFPFNNGNKAQDIMTRYFDNGKIYGTTQKGTLDLVGITIKPTSEKIHELDLAFIDLAGEDIEKIKTSNNGDFTAKINAVFNGLQVTASPVIFLLITPFKPGKGDNYLGDAEEHQKEDQLHFDFINYLQVNQPRLFENSRFVVLVSKWDMNSDPRLTVEDFIVKQRPSLYRSIMNSNVSIGHYSIGRILSQMEDLGSENYFEAIVEKNEDSPSRLWRRVYTICTGGNLDRKSFWQRLFS
jgi:hypothetical protein